MINDNEIADQLIERLSVLVQDGERSFRDVMNGWVGVFNRGDDLRVEITPEPGVVKNLRGWVFAMPTPTHDLFRSRQVPPGEFRDWAVRKKLDTADIDLPVFDDLDIFLGDFDEQVTWALQTWVLKGGASETFRAEILQKLPSLKGAVVEQLQSVRRWHEERDECAWEERMERMERELDFRQGRI